MLEPPSGCPKDDTSERLVFRRGRLRKREDDEVRMIREALASLEDLPRVKRLLLELGRFYNPVTNGPVIGPDVRRAVIERLEDVDLDGARAVLEQQLTLYLKMDDPPQPSSRSPANESGGPP